MARPGIVKTVGAHDALSAKLIEQAGFDAVWASGFGISASLKCIPDGSFLTMTEQLDVTRNIAEAVDIPIIADCDTGFGNALNVMRMVQDYEKAGPEEKLAVSRSTDPRFDPAGDTAERVFTAYQGQATGWVPAAQVRL